MWENKIKKERKEKKYYRKQKQILDLYTTRGQRDWIQRKTIDQQDRKLSYVAQ